MNKPWKQEERHVATLLKGSRFKANTGGRIDVESPHFIAQVKHVKTLSLAKIEALATEMYDLGHQCGKEGLVVVKRRAGKGIVTTRLVIMTEGVFKCLLNNKEVVEDIYDEAV